jgi:hypothetical protein
MFVGVASSHEKYAPLLKWLTPFEHLNVLNQDVKSRILREPSDKI